MSVTSKWRQCHVILMSCHVIKMSYFFGCHVTWNVMPLQLSCHPRRDIARTIFVFVLNLLIMRKKVRQTVKEKNNFLHKKIFLLLSGALSFSWSANFTQKQILTLAMSLRGWHDNWNYMTFQMTWHPKRHWHDSDMTLTWHWCHLDVIFIRDLTFDVMSHPVDDSDCHFMSCHRRKWGTSALCLPARYAYHSDNYVSIHRIYR